MKKMMRAVCASMLLAVCGNIHADEEKVAKEEVAPKTSQQAMPPAETQESSMSTEASKWVDQTKKLGKTAWDASKKAAGKAADATQETAGEAYDATKEKSSSAWKATKKAAGDIYDTTKEKASEVYESIKSK